jgi:hypothetical protein
MGANMVNTACEALAPTVEELTGGRVVLRILSNLADRRLARASCVIPAEALATAEHPGFLVAERIVEAYALAAVDPYRAATHNKGIMNGIDAVVIATGNDWRAVEAGAHAYAARTGRYQSLSTWSLGSYGDDLALVGHLEVPLAVGTVGGATRVHHVCAHCVATVIDQMDHQHRTHWAVLDDANLDITGATVQADYYRIDAVSEGDQPIFLSQQHVRRALEIPQGEHLDLTDHQGLCCLRPKTAGGPGESGGETSASHHRRFLDYHRNQDVAAVHHKIRRHTHWQCVGADHVFDHFVGLGESERILHEHALLW